MRSTGIIGRQGASLLIRAGDFFFRYRNAVFPLALVVLFVGFQPVYPGGSVSVDRWMDALGIAVAVAGQSLRVAVVGSAYIQRGGRKGRVYAARLVSQGFFAHSRNPLYVGNLLILLGLFIVHNNPWVYAIGIPFFLFAYRAIVASEEAYLRREFGAEYDDYCRRVRRWLPDFRGLRRSLAGLRFDWRRVVIKEYGSAYAWLATLFVLLAYERLIYADFNEEFQDLAVLGMLLVVATGGWGVARYFKKGGLLADQR